MKRHIIPWIAAALLGAVAWQTRAESNLTGAMLADRGLPAGPALKTLPQGAVAHLQLNNLLGGLEAVEKIVVPALPIKLLPPDAQGLLQMEHPLLTVLGMQRFQAPLNDETFARGLGVAPREPIGLTFYPGDPRQLWVLSVPIGNRAALAGAMCQLLGPQLVEEITLGDRTAVRIVPRQSKAVPELYLLCSESTAFVCGGRAAALALLSMPSAERLDQDTFISRTLPEVDDQLLALVINPDWLKPLALQLQQVRSIGLDLLRQHRDQILQQIPPMVRDQIEMQLRTEMGVEDLDQFADFAEAIVSATVTQFVDWLTNRMLSFEGLTVSVGLGDRAPELRLLVYSSTFQPDRTTGPIPLDEVREALAWLGRGFDHVTISGRQPVQTPSPALKAWLQNVRREFDSRGLKSVYFDRLAELVEDEQPIRAVETGVPWTLSTCTEVQPARSIEEYDNLLQFLREMPVGVTRPVKLVPDRDLDFLEEVFAAQTAARNHNREGEVGFIKATVGRPPMLDHVFRFDAIPAGPAMRRFNLESAWLTRGGIFGYDQHELVNRKVVHAREFDRYLVFHQGAFEPEWLERFEADREPDLAPAVGKLLDEVPDGANHIEYCRLLNKLPRAVAAVAAFEDLLHRDAQGYLDKARAVLAEHADLEAGIEAVKKLPQPLFVYSLNRNPQSGDLYCLLPPGNIVFPRAKVVPVVQRLLAAYAERADDGGGILSYTRVRPESFECSIRLNTEGFAALVSSLGNSFVEQYGAPPMGLMNLAGALANPRDGSSEVADQVLVRNPRWAGIPGPQPKRDATPVKSIPSRPTEAPEGSVDLSAHYNAALRDSWHAATVDNNTLAHLPTGTQEFGGVRFDVRGIVQLNGTSLQEQGRLRYPAEVTGISVGRTARKVHFLHAAGWQAPMGTRIGSYGIRYADGDTIEIPIVYGEDVKDWWHHDDEPAGTAKVAWTGQNTAYDGTGPPISLYRTTWNNPKPDVKIERVDYRSAMTTAAPFLIAITVE